MDLDRVEDHLVAGLAGEVLGHGDLLRDVLLRVHHGRDTVIVLFGDLDQRGHVDQLVHDDLLVENGFAECFTGLGIFYRFLQGELGNHVGVDGQLEPFVLEIDHDTFEAVALLSQKVRDRDLAIFKTQFRGVRSVPSHLADFLGHLETRTGGLDDHQADSLVSRPSRPHSRRDEIGAGAARNESFGPVHDVVVPLADGARRNVGDVRTGIGFRNAQCRYLVAPQHRNHETLPLLLVSQLEDVRCGNVVRRNADGRTQGAAADQLFYVNDEHELVAGRAAVFFGEFQTEETRVTGFLVQTDVEYFLFFPFLDMGLDLFLHEFPDAVAEDPVVLAEVLLIHLTHLH